MKSLKLFLFITLTLQSFALDIIVPKAPPAIPAIKAAENNNTITIHYFTDAVTQVVPKIMQNKNFVYAIPTNLAAKLKNKGKDLQLLAITTEGLLSIVSNKNISSLDQLNGKEIYVGGQGSSPDVITQYILNKNNVNVDIKYRTSAEVAKLAISGKIDFAVLPEPLATLSLFKNKKLNRSFVYSNEWKKLNEGQGIPQVGFFASKAFIKNNNIEIQSFLNDYAEAVVWVNNSPAQAAKLGKNSLMLPMPAKVIEMAIPNMNLAYISANNSKESVINYLDNLIKINKKILSKLPKEDFYEN